MEDARRPLTRAYEQALKHQNALLRAEVERLTGEVEALRVVASASGSENPNPPGGCSPQMKDGPSVVDASPSRNLSPPKITSDSAGTAQYSLIGHPREESGWNNGELESTSLRGLVRVESVLSRDAREEAEVEAEGEADFAESEGGDDEQDTSGADLDSVSEDESATDDESEDSDVDVDKALVAPHKTLFVSILLANVGSLRADCF